MMKENRDFNLSDSFLKKGDLEKMSKKFKRKMRKNLIKNKKSMYSLKGSPEIFSYSRTFGFYIGKNFGLYLSKNSDKNNVDDIKIEDFYLKIENDLINNFGDQIEWRSNLMLENDNIIEIEIIPMAFQGDYLLNVLKNFDHVYDEYGLVNNAIMQFGKIISNIILDKGYKSTYPKYIKNMDNVDDIFKEVEEADFFIEIRHVGKSFFSSMEKDVIDKYSDSDIEIKVGYELIKEGIPFLVQYEIKSDFPNNESKIAITKPDFLIIDPYEPIAIFCDSYKYHQRKKDQVKKDKRIDRKLQQMGFTVLRFTDDEINYNLQNCIEEIKSHYLGVEYALSTIEIMNKNVMKIQYDMLTEWEKRFINSLKKKIKNREHISLKEEKTLSKILEKQSNPDIK